MKALLQFAIEIDFDKIIDNDSLTQLQKFTGAQTKEGVGSFYLDSLAKAIIDSHLRQDHIAYSVEGTIIPTENPVAVPTAPQEDGNTQDLSAYSMVDVVGDEQAPVVDIEESFEQVDSDVSVLDVAVNFLERVSIRKGLPEQINLTAELFDKFLGEINGTASLDAEKTTWFGIEVNRVHDEYAMAIVYRAFTTGELETEYLHTLAQTL